MKKKELYETPSVETYDVIMEGNVLQTASPNGKWDDSIQQGTNWDTQNQDNYGLI